MQVRGGLKLDKSMLDHSRAARFRAVTTSVPSPPEDLVMIEVARLPTRRPQHWTTAVELLHGAHIDWEYLLERSSLSRDRLLACLIYARADGLPVPPALLRRLWTSITRS
jgi:hypothetical protein